MLMVEVENERLGEEGEWVCEVEEVEWVCEGEVVVG